MAWTYILKCSDNSLYTGSTRNLDERLFQHQQGLGAEYTRTRLPVELLAAFEFDNIGDAFGFEKRVQGWSRAKKLALINGRLDDIEKLNRRGLRPALVRPQDQNPAGRGQGPDEMRRTKRPQVE